jgi:hypothetical protein
MNELFDNSQEDGETQMTQQSSQVEEMRMQMNGGMNIMSQLLASSAA